MVLPRKRILVADADGIVLALITHILTRQGYTVDPAVKAEQAAALLRDRSYDAVVIDLSMPGLLPIIADKPALAGHIVLTGGADAGIDLPIHSVIRKPIEFGLLVETVAKCVKPSD